MTFAAILGLLVLVADANGAGVIDRLIEWGSEVFSLQPTSGIMELETVDENGFRSLQDALDYYEVKDAAIPTWIPERYSIARISVLDVNATTIVSGKYVSGNDELLIRATIRSKGAFTYEKDVSDGHILYTTHGITFILSTNLEEERAVWTADGYAYSAGGDVTEKELKKMLDSIQIKE